MCFRLYQESFPGNKPTAFPTNTSRGKHPGPRCQQWDGYPCFPEYPAAAMWNAVVLLPLALAAAHNELVRFGIQFFVWVVIREIAHVITGTVAVNKVIHIALKEHIRLV